MEMTWEKYQQKTNKIPPKNLHLWQPGGEGATRPERFMAFPHRWDLQGAGKALNVHPPKDRVL
jgi:hypothetical protein